MYLISNRCITKHRFNNLCCVKFKIDKKMIIDHSITNDRQQRQRQRQRQQRQRQHVFQIT